MPIDGREQELGVGIGMSYNNARMNVGRDNGCYNTVVNYAVENPRGPNKIAEWLRKPSMNYKTIQEDTRNMRTPETIRWFFDLQEYLSWVYENSEEHRSLRCIGMPGAGKTVLASAIIEDLEQRFTKDDPNSEPRAVLYIYFKHDRQAIQTTPIVLCNLLSQLVQMRGDPSESILQFFKDYEHDLTLMPGKDRIMKSLRSEISSHVITHIVVDALDEFSLEDPSSASALVRDLERLDVKLLITSRHDIDFTSGTSSKIEVSASEADVKIFIRNYISANNRLSRFIERSPGLESHILGEITSKSQGMFLIAGFLMDWISGMLTVSEIRQALTQLPSGLEGMYKLTMEIRIGSLPDNLKRVAHYALSWVLLAKRPLSIEELQHIVAFELQNGNRMVSEDDLLEKNDILSACAGLVVVCTDDHHECGRIQFVHFSAQEFLSKYCDVYFPEAKLRVVQACLRYLVAFAPGPLIPTGRGSDFPAHLCECGQSCDDYISNHPDQKQIDTQALDIGFAQYAFSQWGSHAFDVDDHERLDLRLMMDEFFTCCASSPSMELFSSAYKRSFFSPHVQPAAGMSPLQYKLLFFAAFGLVVSLSRCMDEFEDTGGSPIAMDLEVRDKEGRTPLYLAVENNHPQMLKLLLKIGASVHSQTNRGRAPLHCAALHGKTNIILTLLHHGAITNTRDVDGNTEVYDAILGGNLEVVELLLTKGAYICISNDDGETLLHRAAFHGLSDVVAMLLDKGLDINALDDAKHTPIVSAIDRGHMETAYLLLAKGADIHISKDDEETFLYLLHHAASYGRADMITILLDKGLDIDGLDDDAKTPIFTATAEGHLETVTLLLAKGADIHIHCREGRSLLHLAAYHRKPDIAAILLDNGLDIDALDGTKNTPIFTAMAEGHLETVTLLLAKGADIHIHCRKGRSLLHLAAYHGKPDIVAILLDNGLDIDALDSTKNTPIFSATEGGHLETVYLLLTKGADIHISNLHGMTLLHQAAYHGRSEIVTILLNEGLEINAVDVDNATDTPIVYAMERGHLETVNLLLAIGADIHMPGSEGKTLLHRSAYRGQSNIVAFLLDNGLDIDALDDAKRTPIFSAMERGHLDTVNLLLAKGADIHIPCSEGRSLLHLSAYCGQSNIVAFLLDNGLDIDALDDAKKTPIFSAVEREHLETANLLLNRGADITLPDKHGRTLLHRVAYGLNDAYLGFAATLLQDGLDINSLDNDGHTPVFSAVEAESERYCLTRLDAPAMVKWLLENGADSNICCECHGTVLHRAASLGQAAGIVIVSSLLDNGADINARDSHGRSPIFFSSSRKIVWRFIEMGADINIVNDIGETLLHIVGKWDRGTDIAANLLEKGLDINARDSHGCTPILSVASRQWHLTRTARLKDELKHIVKLLLQKGADIDIPDHNGETLLHLVASNGWTDTARTLLQRGMNINSIDETVLRFSLR